MREIEKYGASWCWSEHDGEIRYETYDERLDQIAAVHEQSPNVYVACLYSRTPGQDGRSVWRQGPGALFNDLRLAKDHIRNLIANPSEVDTSQGAV